MNLLSIKSLYLSLIMILSCQLTWGQTSKTNAEIAARINQEAIKLMDQGYYAKSIKILKECKKLDPTNITYPYEIAYAYYLQRKYKKAITILEGLKNHKDVTDLVYQLLGNAYGYYGKGQKAFETYQEGLRLIPYSGPLNLEMGYIYINAQPQDLDKALAYFEKGIEVAPTFPSNYYWATKIYSHKNEIVWSMLYGEIFLNLERNGKYFNEISKLMFDNYKKSVKFTSDTSFILNFTNATETKKTNPAKPSYETDIYESTMFNALKGISDININSLDTIRTRFLNLYYKNGYDINYPNALISFQKQIEDAGHLEAYNHGILMYGDEQNFKEWQALNTDKWKSFVDWFAHNGIQLDEINRFHRQQFN